MVARVSPNSVSPQPQPPVAGSNLGGRQQSSGSAIPDMFAPEHAGLSAPRVPLSEQIQQKQNEIRGLLVKLAGSPEALSQIAGRQGMTFEEFTDEIMINAIKGEQKKVEEQLYTIQHNGHPGTKGWLANRAADVAGVAGAALGGIAGGYMGGAGGAASGASVGQQVMKDAVSTATGYPADGPNSMQVQMLKLDSLMKSLDRMMGTATSIQEKSHQAVMRVVGNLGRA
ncbi:MAG: hypothetical protein JKY15_01120 [Deltaproteobacteria bacterium]|nr:hypothetical protein [Deltaproteobacteria bacterium]